MTQGTDNSHLKKEVYYFHQGQGSTNHPELGENADHISKKGMVYRMEVYDNPLPNPPPVGEGIKGVDETLLKTEITKWTSEIQGKRWRTYKERETKSMYAGGEVSSTAIEYAYDGYNNPLEKREYGEVKKMAENGEYQDIP